MSEKEILKLALENEKRILKEFESYTEEEKKDYIKTYQEKHRGENNELTSKSDTATEQ